MRLTLLGRRLTTSVVFNKLRPDGPQAVALEKDLRQDIKIRRENIGQVAALEDLGPS